MRLADTPLKLAGLVALSFALRVAAALGHSTPDRFPDEYIYAALGRSIGLHGDLRIRGAPAHFPSLLEPLLASPLWALASTETAYRLVQVENALFMSAAAIPAYVLARQLRLSRRYSFLCATFAIAIPDLVFSAEILTGPVAYPLVLGSLCAGLAALVRPSRRSQLAFLALAGLAAAARVQYVTLFLAFALAAVVLERRSVLRTYRVVAAVLGTAILAALALGTTRTLGYYSRSILHLHVGGATLRWALVDLFLLALVSGVILVPGAVTALLRPRGRAETAFALLAAGLVAGTLLEAALFASNGTDRFQERYLFVLLPFVPIAFGLYLRRMQPSRLPGLLLAAVLLVALSLAPLSAYTAGSSVMDSPFLAAVALLEAHVGVAAGSLLIALLGSLAALCGLLPPLLRRETVAVGIAVVVVSATSVAAARQDIAASGAARALDIARDPAWIDAQHLDAVTAIQTPYGPRPELSAQLFWNTSVTRELLLDGAIATDGFAAHAVRVARDGTLRAFGSVVRSPFLFQGYAVSATLTGVRLVARETTFQLWKPITTPRVRVLAVGRYWDGWLMWRGGITVWPGDSGEVRGVLSFTLSLPRSAQPVEMLIGSRRLLVRPGKRLPVRFHLHGHGPQTLVFASNGGTSRSGTYAPDVRPVSVRSTMPVFRSG